MTPDGEWKVVAHGTNGILNINVETVGTLPSASTFAVTGTLQMAPNSTSEIAGTWDATEQLLTFSVVLFPIDRTTYTGYLFQAGDPLFNEPPGDPSSLSWNVLAGTVSYPPTNVFRGVRASGWMARQPI
jgi:hypothetical protein